MSDEGTTGEGDGLDALGKRIDALHRQHRYASARRLLDEAIPRARAERDLESLVRFLFLAANDCNSTMEPAVQRERSVELVTLLESEDAARRVAPDLDEGAWERERAWYTSCAYDNLAKATGGLRGFNSDGMQGAIAEGIEKCRQTGKTQCIACFREYAVYVHLASDDLGLASAQARHLTRRDPTQVSHDLRVVGWKELGKIALLEGRPREAVLALRQGHAVAEGYHDPVSQRLELEALAEAAALLAGDDGHAAWVAGNPVLPGPPRGEYPTLDLARDRLEAVRAAARGDLAAALGIHRAARARCDERRDLDTWFEESARLASLLRLAGDEAGARALAEEVRARARPARDWLTVRRLAAVVDGPVRNPLGSLAPFDAGPFAQAAPSPRVLPVAAVAAVAAEPEPEPEHEHEHEHEHEPEHEHAHVEVIEDTPRPARMRALLLSELLTGNDAPEVRRAGVEVAVGEVLATPAAAVEDADEAHAALWCAMHGVAQGIEPGRLWSHARLLARRFPDSGRVQGVLAELAGELAESEADVTGKPSAEEVARLLRHALEVGHDDAHVHRSAGAWFARRGDMSEAERCFARAARLARGWAAPALALAEIYRESDRASDAVEVLDLAIRHGCQEPEVAWQAALGAFGERLWDRAVAYLDLGLTLGVDPEWPHYYRALALLELERHDEAIAAVDALEAKNPGVALQAHALRARAHAGAGRRVEATAAIEAALSTPLRSAPALTRAALLRNTELLRTAALTAERPDLAARVLKRAARAGTIDPDAWRARRLDPANAEVDDLSVFEVTLDQPLPDGVGADPDAPSWEDGWKAYRVTWGVLAADEDGARETALAAQREAHAAPAPEVVAVDRAGGGPFNDRPGVVFVSVREPTG